MSLYTHYKDIDLATMLAEGDEGAFVEIFHRYWSLMYNTAFKRLRNNHLSEDLVQNIFVDVWERRGRIKIDNLSSYLQTAVRFQVIKQMTRQPLIREFIEEPNMTMKQLAHFHNPVLEKELMMMVNEWISSLPRKKKEIFTMYYEDDLSTSQIANRMGLAQKTVQNQLNSAIKTLKVRISRFIVLSTIIDAILN